MNTDETPHPGQMRPLTDEEGVAATADWRAYRVAHGANGAPAVLRAENRAFLAGWIAGRHRESQRSSGKVYIIQDETGDVIDVTDSREYAEWLTREAEDNPIRTMTEETVWSGPVDRVDWE